jgi:lipoprotein-anchoring transpeptidase ErfK/SrfK
MPNYREILSRALRKGDFADPFWRREVYGRTRQMLVQQLRRTQPSVNDGKRQLAAFDATIESIESEFEHAIPGDSVPEEELRPVRRGRPAAGPADKPRDGIAAWILAKPVFSVVVAVAIAVIVAGVYALLAPRTPHQNTPAPAPAAKNEAPAAGAPVFRGKRRVLRAASLPEGEVAPGVDGGSSESDVTYVFRRQPVFYRTTHPVGTIVVDKPQHFLYLVQPKSVALRYGIAVGNQCTDVAGLRRISSKAEWPACCPQARSGRRHARRCRQSARCAPARP